MNGRKTQGELLGAGEPDKVVLRQAGEADLDIAAELFRGYLEFYEVEVEDPGGRAPSWRSGWRAGTPSSCWPRSPVRARSASRRSIRCSPRWP